MIEPGLAAALNHLLARESWARQKLAPFAGEVVELRFSPLPSLRLAILADGLVAKASEGAPSTLTISGRPELLATLLRAAGQSGGEEHLMHAVDISGNARLATEVLALLRYLRWDIEEDLSRVVGDVIAHRVVGTAKDFAAWQADAAKRFSENVSAYVIEERRMVLARPEFEDYAHDVAEVRDAVARLEQRLARLERQAGQGKE